MTIILKENADYYRLLFLPRENEFALLSKELLFSKQD